MSEVTVIEILDSDISDDGEDHAPKSSFNEGSRNIPITVDSSTDSDEVVTELTPRNKIMPDAAVSSSILKRPPSAVAASAATAATEVDSSDDEIDMELHRQKLGEKGKGVPLLLETLVKKEAKIEMVDKHSSTHAQKERFNEPSVPKVTREKESMKPKVKMVDDRKKTAADPNRRGQTNPKKTNAAQPTQPINQQKPAPPSASRKDNAQSAEIAPPIQDATKMLVPSSSNRYAFQLPAKKAATAEKDGGAKPEMLNVDDSDATCDDLPQAAASSKISSFDNEVVSICDSEESGDDTKAGKNKETAICLSSDDDDDDDGLRPQEARLASKFSQFCGLPLPTSVQRTGNGRANSDQNWARESSVGRSGHVRAGAAGARKKVEPKSVPNSKMSPNMPELQKGERMIGLNNDDTNLAALGRKGHGSRLGLSIEQKGASNHAKQQSRPTDASDESDYSSSSKGHSSFSPKKSSFSRKARSEIREGILKKISSDCDDDKSSIRSGEDSKLIAGSASDSDNSKSLSRDGDDNELEQDGDSDSALKLSPASMDLDTARPKNDSTTNPNYKIMEIGAKLSNRHCSEVAENMLPPNPRIDLKGAVTNHEAVALPDSKSHTHTEVGTDVEMRRPKKTCQKSVGGLSVENAGSNAIATGVRSEAQCRDHIEVTFRRAKKTSKKAIGPAPQRKATARVEDKLDHSVGSEWNTDKVIGNSSPAAIESAQLYSRKRRRSHSPENGLDPCNTEPPVQREIREIRCREAPTPPLEAEVSSEEKFIMIEVPHLRSITYPKGLPCRRFTVYGSHDDSILYDFEVNIKQSMVSKNAGLGAFFVFRGARVLKADRKRANAKKLNARDIFNPETLETLEATLQDGSGVRLNLTGKHLHGHNNSLFRTATEAPLRASVGQQKVTVNLVGKNLHRDIDEDGSFDLPCCPKAFGRLCLNIESDYIWDNSREYPSELAKKFSIEFPGRYGPVGKADRKRQVDFDTKSFFFDHEPSGWDFGVDESLLGGDQMIDVTGDDTGEPHHEARKQPAIYVNEVGHNSNLVHNVFSSSIGGNVVQYFIELKHGMKRGKEVELLTNYFAHYEPNRERRGYGIANLNGETKSDCDLASRLKRNFFEREGIESMVATLDPLELFYTIEFVCSRILPHLTEGAKRVFTMDSQRKSLTPRQLMARRRMHWIAPLYLERVNALEGQGFKEDDEASKKASKRVVAEMNIQCKEWIEGLKWDALHSQSLPSPLTDQALKKVFDRETLEEALYHVRDQLEDPMDVNMWCPIARDLTISLCTAAFEQLRFGPNICREKLATAFLRCATNASESIRTAKKSKTYCKLSFSSGTEGGLWVNAGAKNLVVLGAGTALSNSLVIKGATSSLMDAQAYSDLCDLGILEPQFEMSRMERTCDGAVVIVRSPLGKSGIDGMPRRIDFVTKQYGEINENWYLVWQNVYLVHTLFKSFVQKFAASPADHALNAIFLNQLCRSVTVDVAETNAAIATTVRKDLASPQTIFRSTAELDSQRKRKRKEGRGDAALKRTTKLARAFKSKKRKSAKSGKRAGGGPVSMQLFWKIIWSTLTELGWTRVQGNRVGDNYFCPKGVQRGPGFRPRIDFFDSFKLVKEFLKKDHRWRDNKKVVECLALFEECQAFLRERRVKGQLKIEWVIAEVKKKNIC